MTDNSRAQRVVVIGVEGQLGTALAAALGSRCLGLTHRDVEITDAASVAARLQELRPDVVVNTAAYNAVDKAEDEPDRAWAVNALGPRVLARACAGQGCALVHVSTDYVFGQDAARSTPYREADPPGPLGVYAVSKWAGEAFVRAECPRHFVVRTCGLYGRATSPGKGNFVKTMLRLGRERGTVSVVNDQHCTPSYTPDVAAALVALLGTEHYGLYHAVNSGATTWYDLAREIFRITGEKVEVRPITTAEFPTRARRPPYSVLDGARLAAVCGGPLRPWQEALAAYLAEPPV